MSERCEICGQASAWKHDHQPDQSGIDDGPPLPGARKKYVPKSPEEYKRIRAQAWQTRRAKYGEHGHK